MWLSTLACELNNIKAFSSPVTHVTFQGLLTTLFYVGFPILFPTPNTMVNTWPVATTLNNVVYRIFHHHKRFCWAELASV